MFRVTEAFLDQSSPVFTLHQIPSIEAAEERLDFRARGVLLLKCRQSRHQERMNMSCVNRGLIFLEDDSLGMPEIFLPRNRIFIHRGDDLARELSPGHFEIIVIVNLFKHLSDFKNTDNLSDETSTHDGQNPCSFWPVVSVFENRDADTVARASG